MNDFITRPFTEADYPSLAHFHEAVYAEFATSEEELRRDDSLRPAYFHHTRLMVEQNGTLVAVGEFDQEQGRYHPQRFLLWIDVLPEFQNRGIGTGLYATLTDELASLKPEDLHTYIREDNPAGLRFAQKRGFHEARRTFASQLDVAQFADTTEPLQARLQQEGIVFRTYPELASDPERDHKLHRLCEEIRADFPAEVPATPRTFDEWQAKTIHNPQFVVEAFQVAVDTESRYVGYNSVSRNEEKPGELWTGQTGVVRSYRRRGIASVLKARGAVWAGENDYHSIHTTNDSTNAAMLVVNEHMGFVRQVAWLYYKKTFL